MSRSSRLLALAGVLAAALPALAVDTVIRRGGEFVVNSRTYGVQRRVDVASSSAGEFVIVWQTFPNYEFDIHAQRYDAAGARKGGEIDVTADPFAQDHPSVGVAADGSFVVVWEDYDDVNGGYQIAARRFGSAGAPAGSEFTVNNTPGTYYNTAVATAPAGDFIVAWASYSDPDDGDQAAVRARRFDAAGTPLANDFLVNTYTTGFQDSAALVRSADGSFVVVWQDATRDAIVAQRYDNAGAALGGEILANTSPACCGVEVRADGAPDGRFVVVWRSGLSSASFDIVGRRFDSAGSPIGSEFVVNSVTTGPQFRADVTMAPDGSFVVAWMNDGAVTDVFARRFDATGAPLGGDFQVNRDHEGDANYSASLAVTGADDGTFVVAWRSGYEYGSESDIIAQRFFNGTVGCTAAPRGDCRKQTAAAGIFQLRNSGDDDADKLVWRWPRGEATDLDTFGDPVTNTAVALCVYDASAAPQPIATVISPAQGPCRRGTLCWTQLSGPVFRYFDGDKTNDGLHQIYLRAGGDGRTRIGVRAKGEKLPLLPSPPLTTPVTVQLQSSAGSCFTATYSGNVTANGGGEFKARPDAP